MSKYYISFLGKRLIMDARSPGSAAAVTLRTGGLALREGGVVYVDERGHRTRTAAHRFRLQRTLQGGDLA